MNAESLRWETLCTTVEQTYHVFAHYKLTGPICCEMSDRVLVPERVPLRQRGMQDFERYQGKAITTLGTVEDYKHFLPRLIEMNCAQQRRRTVFGDTITCEELMAVGIGLDMIAMKLEYAQASLWPSAERDVLEAFGIARWWWELTVPANYHGGIREAMAVLTAVGRPLCEYLSRMFASAGDAEFLGLSRFVNGSVTSSVKCPVLRFKWASDRSDRADPLERWLLSPEVETALEAAFFRATEADAAEELSNAVQNLRWLRQSTVKFS